MPRKRRPKTSDRRQAPETWGVCVFRLRTWVAPEDEPPYLPDGVFVLDVDSGWMLGAQLFKSPVPAAEVYKVLEGIIHKPLPGTGGPRRPARVVCDDPALVEALADPLAALNIACEAQPLPMLAEVVKEFEAHLRGGEPEPPSMLSVAGVTPELVGGVFAAAADFYRAAPWIQLDNSQAFALTFPAQGGSEWVVSVMGGGGVEYGLAVYKSWDNFARLFVGVADSPMEMLAAEGQIGLTLGKPSLLPFEDFEAIEQYGWEVADTESYPLALVFQSGEEVVRRPGRAEMAFLEAALRAVPQALREHMRADDQGDFQPLETTLTVPTHRGERQVLVRYPAGALPLEERRVGPEPWDRDRDDEGEDLPLFDRRGLEGALAELVAGFDQEGMEERDPALQKAQQLMYRAFETENPARRLNLAHEALAASPDCADAYVLLAEEEADTLARAEELYRAGVAAGERALGPAYFKQNKGYFWGLLETRPYMRARAGLAFTLWSLNRSAEAAEHYRALLELNPNDNQGVRYSLLGLLLDMKQDAEARALLKQYREDGMAEWLYTWALLEFRQKPEGKAAVRRLKAALKENPYVPAYLTGARRIPIHLPPYHGIGDDAEAVHYANRFLNHWRSTPGAVEWLKSHAPSTTH